MVIFGYFWLFLGENSGLGDWSFDNLDEIVAVAIKAEFHTMDLAELGKWGHSVEKREIPSQQKYFVKSDL